MYNSNAPRLVVKMIDKIIQAHKIKMFGEIVMLFYLVKTKERLDSSGVGPSS